MEADGGAAEGVRLDDVRARFEVAAMDFVDHFGLGQEKNFQATLQVRNKLLAAYKDIMSMPV